MSAGIVYDEHVRVYWLDTDPADPDAPTVAEITAGTNLSEYVISDGVTFGLGNSRVDDSDLMRRIDAESMGRYQASPALMLRRRLRGSNAEVAWTTLEQGATGALVVFPFIEAGDDPGAGDDCYVYTGCETGLPILQDTAKNTSQRFRADIAVGGDVYLNAVVAA